jgi:putative transposase
MIAAIAEHRDAGVAAVCDALSLPRATYYRALRPTERCEKTRPASPRALSDVERERALELLHSERFADRRPDEIVATLLDEGTYVCSPRTMYRILAANREVRERRAQTRHPQYAKPELLAQAPNEVWTWDITKLLGPEKGTYYCLYVVLDIFSRYVVGWMLARTENGELATRLVRETCLKQGVELRGLKLHSDRGTPMTSRPLSQLLSALGIERSLSRPHVSNDNPFIESHFKTLKYGPGFPARFGSFEDALAHCERFFAWYNAEHRHAGIANLTPADVHHGHASQVLAARENVMRDAFARNPERFTRGSPRISSPPTATWINPPPRPLYSPVYS